MEVFDFNQYANSNNEDERNQLIQDLLSNSQIQKMCEKHQIPQNQIQQSPYLFQSWLKKVQSCVGCSSLNECKQKKKGYRAGIRYDGILQEVLEACPYQREKEKKEEHMRQYLMSDMSPALVQVSFENIDVTNESASYIKAVQECIDACMNQSGVYLHGTLGTGKTYLSACASNYMAKRGYSCAFIHYPTFCENLTAKLNTGESKADADRLAAVQMLVIDDIGAENVTEKNRAYLLSILDRRMQNNRMTWFTSNEDFNSLLDHFANTYMKENTVSASRLLERIKTLSKPVLVVGSDRRIFK